MLGYLLLLILVSILGISIGSVDIPINIVLRILMAKILPWIDTSNITEAQQVIVWLIRVPRVLIAALVGAALAIAGTQMQGLFQNPLASPGIIGTSSGGALGSVIALASGLASYSMFYIPIFASVGALLALFIVYILATQNGKTPVAVLLLAGIALNALIAAMTSFIITVAWVEYDIAREIVFWLMGGLDNRTWSHVWIALPGILIGGIIAIAYIRELDILLMGQETAYSLGIEVEKVQWIILFGTGLLTGTAVAVSGVIGFVGLIIPHMVRLFVGPKHRYLIPLSAIIGAVFLILVDLLARTITSPTEIRLGILTAGFGAPFFLYLLRKHSQL
ncbi:MAG TPA: iron ABC transporter permease [Thioploca sp.]|nr:iron ABC transporter permease [Thioploca sp.]